MDETKEKVNAERTPKHENDRSTEAEQEQDDKDKATNQWWQNPTTVTLLVAIVAAVPALTTGIQGFIQGRSQLKLERNKQLHDMRQKYLDRVLSDTQNQGVLEFLVAVEEDQKLKTWAKAELAKTEGRIKTKQELYRETISVGAGLANQDGPIDQESPKYKDFWALYNEKLLPVESQAVESLMVRIGRELQQLSEHKKGPSEELKALSFTLASTMKEELR
jgi:hypothetical protein